jgi:hypothetical protein
MSESIAVMPLWGLIFTALGLMIGMALGDEVRRRKNAEEQVEDLRDQLKRAPVPLQDRQLKEIRSVLNDAHKHILAVTKGLEKQPR